jgi:hypothetical protein
VRLSEAKSVVSPSLAGKSSKKIRAAGGIWVRIDQASLRDAVVWFPRLPGVETPGYFRASSGRAAVGSGGFSWNGPVAGSELVASVPSANGSGILRDAVVWFPRLPGVETPGYFRAASGRAGSYRTEQRASASKGHIRNQIRIGPHASAFRRMPVAGLAIVSLNTLRLRWRRLRRRSVLVW